MGGMLFFIVSAKRAKRAVWREEYGHVPKSFGLEAWRSKVLFTEVRQQMTYSIKILS